MRTVQGIFNVVIRKGFYTDDRFSTSFMCNALDTAWWDDVITGPEMFLALCEIRGYLRVLRKAGGRKCSALENALELVGLPNDFEARLAIYKDWKNRPFPR